MNKFDETFERQNTEVAVHEEQTLGPTDLFEKAPEKALEQMERLVQIVAKKCTGPEFVANIQGKQYPKVEWWTTVGSALGLFPQTEWAKRLDRDDEVIYEARVAVKRNGQTITSAEALCSDQERLWSTRDEHSIKSMAITRATSKAYRIGLSMLAVMAGLEPTPSEEMPQDKPEEFSRDYVITFGKHSGKALRDIPDDYLQWLGKNAKDQYLKDYAEQELTARNNRHLSSGEKDYVRKLIKSDVFTEEERATIEANLDKKSDNPKAWINKIVETKNLREEDGVEVDGDTMPPWATKEDDN